MPAKRTDWKRERKRLQEEDPDKKLGAEILARMRDALPLMQQGQERRRAEAFRAAHGAPPVISHTMQERMCGLFGGDHCRRSRDPRPSAQDAWDRLTD